MNTELLLNNIGKDIFSRNDLYNAAVKELTSFKETDMRNMLEKLLKDRIIIRIAHNQYVRNNNTIAVNEYMPIYSDESKEIITEIKNQYPYLRFQVWELTWFNEFLVHLVAHNKIFVDVENDGCEFIYSTLSV